MPDSTYTTVEVIGIGAAVFFALLIYALAVGSLLDRVRCRRTKVWRND